MPQKSTLLKLLLLILIHNQMFCTTYADNTRIIGGQVCDYDQYPYAVAIFHVYVCGGSLITLEWVLTAAHCVDLTMISKRKKMMRTGFNRDEKFVQLRYAKKGIRHEKFNMRVRPENYDIGILLADSPFKQTAFLSPAKLPYLGFSSKCNNVTAIGVGEERKLKPGEKPTKQIKIDEPLLCVELPVISEERCRKTWTNPHTLYESIICTMDEKGEKDSCQGDSGSPMVCQGVVIGITSAGRGCAQLGLPGIYTKVEYYLDFISNVTGIEIPTEKSSNGSDNMVLGTVYLFIIFFTYSLTV